MGLMLALAALSAPAQLTLNSPQLNQAYLLIPPIPPCSTATASTLGSTSSGQDAFGNAASTTYIAAGFITTNGFSGIPCSVDLVLQTVGSPTWTFQVAVYNDTTPSGSPGAINGAFGSTYNANALTSSLTTNNYALAATAPFSGTVTNYVVIKAIGSPGNFTDYLKWDVWVLAGEGNPVGEWTSTDGVTWSSYNGAHSARLRFYK